MQYSTLYIIVLVVVCVFQHVAIYHLERRARKQIITSLKEVATGLKDRLEYLEIDHFNLSRVTKDKGVEEVKNLIQIVNCKF